MIHISIYSRRQKKLYTSLNRRKIKSNYDRIDLKYGNEAEIHYRYFGVYNMVMRSMIQLLQLFTTKRLENKSCKRNVQIQIVIDFPRYLQLGVMHV